LGGYGQWSLLSGGPAAVQTPGEEWGKMPRPAVQSILETSRGFIEARVLLTGAELDVFTLLAHEPLTAIQVSERLQADLRGVTTLLDALTALEFLRKEDGLYRCEGAVAEALASDSATSVRPMLLHSAHVWQRWSRLTDIVRGASPPPAAGTAGDPLATEAFIGAMHAIGVARAAEIVAAVAPGRARALLDVGGASGTYTEAFLRACPDMCATLFDLPPVIEIARRRLTPTGLLDRITLVPGNFHTDALPGGHDLAFLSAIIHQNSPDQNEALYRRCFEALEPGGRIVIRDHVMSPDHTAPRAGALFAVNMLVATAGGGCYTLDEIRQGLEAAGFADVRQLHAGEQMDGLVEAFRPRGG
jgi:predicted O-methyltransferase YrrM